MLLDQRLLKIGLAIMLVALAVGVAYAAAEMMRSAAGFSAWPMYLAYVLMLPVIGAVVVGGPLLISNLRLEGERDALERQLHSDAVTGVATRGAFFNSAGPMIEQASAAGLPVSLLFVHVDALEAACKTYGAAAGDELLRLVATHLSNVREEFGSPGMMSGRLGRDAFASLLIGADPSTAVGAAERICELVRASGIAFGEAELETTVSVGVTARRAAEDIDTLVSAADAASRQAIEKGGDAWVFAGASRAAERGVRGMTRVA